MSTQKQSQNLEPPYVKWYVEEPTRKEAAVKRRVKAMGKKMINQMINQTREPS